MTDKAKRKVIPFSQYEAGRPSLYHASPPYSAGPDSEFAVSGQNLKDWARHLSDNSAIVAAVLSARQADGIGPGLSYEPLVKDRRGELVPEVNDVIRRLHADWSESADVTGELSRQELERIIWRTWDLDGEAFIRPVVRPEGYRLQIVPTDWIPAQLTQASGDENIIHGIAKDAWGKPTAYYIDPNFADIYSRVTAVQNPDKLIRIAAGDMHHLKRIQYPGQTRGVTLLHAIIFRIADISEYQASHRLAARASADLFASINRSPEVSPDDTDRNWTFDRLQVMDELLPGESVNFHKPENPNQNAVDFVREELRAVAAGCDVGFSEIAQVFDASYAAQRLEVVQTWRKIERDRSKFISDFAKPALYKRVIQQAMLERKLPARALRRVDPLTLYDVRIDGPVMPVIDPVKDRQAFELDQTNGWDSRPGIIRRMGRVPGDVDAERGTEPEPETSTEESTPDEIPDTSERE